MKVQAIENLTLGYGTYKVLKTVLGVLRAGGFSCSLGFRSRGLRTKKYELVRLLQKPGRGSAVTEKPASDFGSGIKSGSRSESASRSALIESGFATLFFTLGFV
jgi:hypothetical protein